LQATGSPTSWSVTGLPAGMSFNSSTGTLTGTPTAINKSEISLTATNATGTSLPTKIGLGVLNPEDPTITTNRLVDGEVGLEYYARIFSNQNTNASYAVNQLPSGLSLNSNTGEITGIPASSGVTSVQITAINTIASRNKTLQIEIKQKQSGKLYSDSLSYKGAFALPIDSSSSNAGGFAYRPVSAQRPNGSLYIGSIRRNSNNDLVNDSVSEVSISTPSMYASVANMQESSVLSGLRANVTQDQINQTDLDADQAGGGAAVLRGLFVDGNKLIISALAVYVNNSKQTYSHFVKSSLDLSTSGNVSAPLRIQFPQPSGWVRNPSAWSGRITGGYMCKIPASWQAAFGADMLTGNVGGSIVTSLSRGPALVSFNSADLGVQIPCAGKMLLGYDTGSELNPDGDDAVVSNPYWNQACALSGVIWPDGTDSVLFFGSQASGTYMYKPGTPGNPYPDAWPVDSEGNAAWPYLFTVYAYDANDLLLVSQGTKNSNAVKPYSVWRLSIPVYDGWIDKPPKLAGGVCLQPASDSPTGKARIFLAINNQDKRNFTNNCVVHVLELN
jgi:hypothetical protein